MNRSWLVLAAALTAVAAVSACSSPEADWQKASAQGSVAAYQDFLTRHPSDAHAAEARSRIASLQDEQAWSQARDLNTMASLQQYLQQEPNGSHAQEAHERITALERAAAWRAVQSEGTPAALQGFLQQYPQGPEAEQARAELQKLNGYRVQLGAFRSSKAAERTRSQLASRYGKLLHEVVVLPSGTDKLNRVSSTPMTQDEARAACAQLKKSRVHCEVVKSG